MKFFVFYGVKTPDNCDASEGMGPYDLVECRDEQAVIDLRKEHEESLESECAGEPIFRVILGDEVEMEPIKKVTTWRLKK